MEHTRDKSKQFMLDHQKEQREVFKAYSSLKVLPGL